MAIALITCLRIQRVRYLFLRMLLAKSGPSLLGNVRNYGEVFWAEQVDVELVRVYHEIVVDVLEMKLENKDHQDSNA